MTPLAQLGYDTLAREIRRGVGPERAWEAVASTLTKAVREHDRRVAAWKETEALRKNVFEQEILRQIQERTK